MKKYLIFLLFLGMSSSLVAQTLKETVRGKYGENLGTAETTIRGGKSVTVYKDKYGQVTGTSESKTSAFGKLRRFTKTNMVKRRALALVPQVMDCSLQVPPLPLIVTSMVRRQVPVQPGILEILVQLFIETSMVKLLVRVL